MTNWPGANVPPLLWPLLAVPALWLVLPFIALPANRAWPTPAGAEVFHQSTGWLIVLTFIALPAAAAVISFLGLVGAALAQSVWNAVTGPDPIASLGFILFAGGFLAMILACLGLCLYLVWTRVWRPWRYRRLPLLIINDAGIWSPGFDKPMLWAELSAADISRTTSPASLVLYQGAPQRQLFTLVRPMIAAIPLNLMKQPISAVSAAIKDKRFRPD